MNPADCQPKLQKEYSRETWQALLPQLLPGVEMFSRAQDFPLTSEHERGIATARRQFGAATLADGKRIAFYEIEVAPNIQLQSNRVGLRSLIVKCIDEVSAHAVLAFFIQPGKSFYRLTYAAKESRLGKDLKITTVQTAPRRFTYILGEGESCRTAAERFGKLPSNTKIADLTDAFSVDKLNKEFFADFSMAFDMVVKDILARNKGWEQSAAERETQTLLNRLLFLYFIQRKGWLDRRRKYLISTFNRFHQDDPEGTSFNDKFLKPFFVKLSAEDAFFPNLELGDLPFLNGGLFDDELGSLTERGRMKVGNQAFRHVFDRLLEAYNFTVREDTPLDQEVAIDPEMIGKIFESLVLQLEQSDTDGKTSRHDTGSYYTPRPIVHYLCREGLRAWLEQFPPSEIKSSDWPKRLEKLFTLDASDGIDDDERSQLNELLTPEEANTLLKRLDDFRACDPAVGSGAFLVGLLHELVNLRRLCQTRSRGKDPAADIEWIYETKKLVIEKVLYGVDIQRRAVEICKLRLWISLMVDYPLEVDPDDCAVSDFRRALKKITPLPNLDFKIRRADSLVEYIRGHAVNFPQAATDSRDFALSLNKLGTAKHRFYEARRKKDKRDAQFDIMDATAELAQYEFNAAKLKYGLLPSDDDSDRVAELARAEAEMGKLQMQISVARRKGEREKDDYIERLNRIFNDEASRNTGNQIKRVEWKLTAFNSGLKNKLMDLAKESQKILDEFCYDITIDFKFDGVAYNRAKWAWEKGFVGMDVGLKVKFFTKERDNHHHFLNEAKLSAIAVSIFFAALLLQPSSRLKILALDDVLIGLDMQNRMPVIDILKKHFNDYQILMLTYDQTWFEIVKRHFPGNGWKKIEFFASKTPDGEVPVFADNKNYLAKSQDYFNLPVPDYGSCVNYLRKHFEEVAREFCERQRLGVNVKADQDMTKVPSSAFWSAIASGQAAGKWPGLAKALLNDIEIYRTFILNPGSHANSTAAYKSEIQRSINAVQALEAGLAAIK